MVNLIYRHIDKLTLLFVAMAISLILFFFAVSNSLVNKLADEERVKLEIWAEAERDLISNPETSSVALASKVITSNTTIPVILTDSSGRIISHNNVSSSKLDTDQTYLTSRLSQFKENNQCIEIPIGDERHYLYYGESNLLKSLSMYPYIQVGIVFVFLTIGFVAFAAVKRAEQRNVWIGLTKETAHQLGTPISSLMALSELIKSSSLEPSIHQEMEKDIARLLVIVERFSKIGSKPVLKTIEVADALHPSVDYIRSRTSDQINIIVDIPIVSGTISISPPLFDWVIENVCKNAIDAMNGSGVIRIEVSEMNRFLAIDFIDDGKGIAKRNFKRIFSPGFTTKRRGWGLGLTLTKRIVEEFFGGKIYVKSSIVGIGSTLRILLPLSRYSAF